MVIKNLPVVLAETGKIKIGKKGPERTSSTGKKYQPPVKLDHFIVTTTERGPDGNFMEDIEVMKNLGGKPKEIEVVLPFNDVESNFVTSLKFYSGRTAICFGDNNRATRKKKDGTVEEVECNALDESREICPYFKSRQCKMTGTLSVILPQAQYLGGVYKYRTTSWHGIIKTMSSLLFLQQLTGGRLAGVRLTMKLLSGMAEISGKQMGFHYVTLVYKGDDIKLLGDLRQVKEIRRDELKRLDMIESDYVAAVEKEHQKTDQDEQQECFPEHAIHDNMVVDTQTGEIVDSVKDTPKEPPPAAATNLPPQPEPDSEPTPEPEKTPETPVESTNSEPPSPFAQDLIDNPLPAEGEVQTKAKKGVKKAKKQDPAKQENLFAKAEVIEDPPPDAPSPINEDLITAPEIPPAAKAPGKTAQEPKSLGDKEAEQRIKINEICEKNGMPIPIWEQLEKKRKITYPVPDDKFKDLCQDCEDMGLLYKSQQE